MNTLKININWLIIAILIFFLTSCINKANLKIGIMFPYTTASSMAIETQFFKSKAKELNCTIEVVDAKNNEQLQRTQAQ